MISQLPYKTYKIFAIIIALCVSYILVSFFLGDTADNLWPQQQLHFLRSGIRDGALDHIFNTTLGVSTHVVYVARQANLVLANLL
jgi:hypothetical protein